MNRATKRKTRVFAHEREAREITRIVDCDSRKIKLHNFAVDELAAWIADHCADMEELARVKEIARRFSYGLAAAIEKMK